MTLPSSVELEGKLLGEILVDNGVIPEVAGIIGPQDFYARYNGLIFQAISDLWLDGQVVDVHTVASKLAKAGKLERIGGEATLVGLTMSADSPWRAGTHARVIKEKALFRQIYHSLSPLVEKAKSGDGDPFEVLDMAMEKVREAGTLSGGGAALIGRAVANSEAILGVEGIQSGISTLDQLVEFRPAELILIGARPSQGKTALGLQICEHAYRSGQIPGVFSIEMSTPQLIFRLVAAKTGIEYRRILKLKLSEDEYRTVKNEMAALESMRMVVDDSAGLSIGEFQRRARGMKAEHGITMLFVDYLQLMTAHGKENREKEVASISAGLKATAKTLGIPVIAASQLSRNSENRDNKRPTLSDLRDSGSLEQDADMVIFIYNPEFLSGSIRQPVEEVELIVSKNRNGETGVAPVNYHTKRMMFTSRGAHETNTTSEGHVGRETNSREATTQATIF